jgi:hypothetical protein
VCFTCSGLSFGGSTNWSIPSTDPSQAPIYCWVWFNDLNDGELLASIVGTWLSSKNSEKNVSLSCRFVVWGRQSICWQSLYRQMQCVAPLWCFKVCDYENRHCVGICVSLSHFRNIIKIGQGKYGLFKYTFGTYCTGMLELVLRLFRWWRIMSDVKHCIGMAVVMWEVMLWLKCRNWLCLLLMQNGHFATTHASGRARWCRRASYDSMAIWREDLSGRNRPGALHCQLVEVTEAFSADQVMHHNRFQMFSIGSLSNVNR